MAAERQHVRRPLRLDMIGMVASDMAATLAFYRRLGLEIPAEADDEQHVEVVGPGGLRLAWDTVEVIRSMYPDRETPAGGGRVTPAFLCAGPEEVDEVHAELTAAGYRGVKEPWNAVWGQRYAVVLDPDGNAVDLFAPLAGGPPAGDGTSS